jgi:hypothetical protein
MGISSRKKPCPRYYLARDGLTVFDRHNKAALEQQQAWLTVSRGFKVQS